MQQHRVFGSPPLLTQHVCTSQFIDQNQTFLTLFMTLNKVTATKTTATVRNIPPATEPTIITDS